MQFILTTDTANDSFKIELDKAGVPWTPLNYTIDGQTYYDTFSSDSEYKSFYDKMAAGAMPTTSLINTFTHEEFFTKILESNKIKTIVHLVLSGGLSETVNSARIAADNIMQKVVGSNIIIVDTICATRGGQILLNKALELRDNNISAIDAAQSLEIFKQSIIHLFMVDDLKHLHRGGRVSKASSVFGSLLKIKPILTINTEGKLAVIKKAKGAKGAISFFMDTIKEHMADKENGSFYILSNCTSKNTADFAETLKSQYPNCSIDMGWVGPVIGSHTGCGTFGVAFVGKKRFANK